MGEQGNKTSLQSFDKWVIKKQFLPFENFATDNSFEVHGETVFHQLKRSIST